jgi:hypothetical protein
MDEVDMERRVSSMAHTFITRLTGVAAGLLLAAGLAAGVAAPGAAAALTVPNATAVSVVTPPCALKFAAGNLYIGAGAVYRLSQRTGALSQLFKPWNGICGVTVDGVGNVLVSTGTGVVALAARTGTFYGKKMTAGHTYLLVSGFRTVVTPIRDVQVDRFGNVVFTVAGSQVSHTNAEYDAQVFALAERTGACYGKKMTAGHLYVLAGVRNGQPITPPGQAAVARSSVAPAGVSAGKVNLGWQIGTLRFDAAGNIVFADTSISVNIPSQVRVIPLKSGTFYGQLMSAGWVYSIAGGGTKWTDGAVATKDGVGEANAVALDHSGNVLIANGDITTISPPNFPGLLVLAAKTGSFYGRAMTAGHLYQVPNIFAAGSVAVDDLGNVLFANAHVYLLAERNGTFYGKKAHAGTVYKIAAAG